MTFTPFGIPPLETAMANAVTREGTPVIRNSRITAGMTVRPLEWQNDHTARPFGLLYIVHRYKDPLGDGSTCWLAQMDTNPLGRHDTFEAAKDAAQADFDRRILDWIATPPADGTPTGDEQLAADLAAVEWGKKPIAIWSHEQANLYHAATDEERAAWNAYAEQEAEKLNNSGVLDSYDSTATLYQWAPPLSFSKWRAGRLSATPPAATNPERKP